MTTLWIKLRISLSKKGSMIAVIPGKRGGHKFCRVEQTVHVLIHLKLRSLMRSPLLYTSAPNIWRIWKRDIMTYHSIFAQNHTLWSCSSPLFVLCENIAVRVRLQKFQRLDEAVIPQQYGPAGCNFCNQQCLLQNLISRFCRLLYKTRNLFYVFADVILYGNASTDECANLVCLTELHFWPADACLQNFHYAAIFVGIMYSLNHFKAAYQGFFVRLKIRWHNLIFKKVLKIFFRIWGN